jgi:hypothetical protein
MSKQRMSDDRPPLYHRTDRIALRNNSGVPVVYVDIDPLLSLAPDIETIQQDPLATGLSDIRHQHYAVDAETLAESETVIREIVDRFDADTGQDFYYTIAGDRAQIGGNGLDDYFDALGNFRTIYRDLDEQLDRPRNPTEDSGDSGTASDTEPFNHMPATASNLTAVGGIWLRFTVTVTETPDDEYFTSASVSITTLEQHGPLMARWLADRLDHPALGPPSPVDRQHVEAQAHLSLGAEPLRNVAEHRLIGYSGREGVIECITCENPYYRVGERARSEQFDRLDEAGVARDVIQQVMRLDRFALRPRGGSTGVTEDLFLGGEITLTRFGTTRGPRNSNVMLLSGTTTPLLTEEVANG